MDQQSFDRLARILGEATDRRAGLKAALAAALGGSAAVAALEAQAKRKGRDGTHAGPDAERRKKRRKTCKPACGSGFDCVKVGKTRECQCATGVTCGDACCRIGQVCEGGACVAEPEPVTCIPAGEPCKGMGRACCDGRVCASGQGGDRDVACYVPKTGRCAATADCVYGMECLDGQCAPPTPAGLAQPCSTAAQQLCSTPGAVCTDYTAANAPGGAFCTLPVGKVCTGDPQCTCYKCFYPNGGAQGVGRSGRASANTRACCYPNGQQCQNDNQCCVGLSCVNGTCGGTMCAPEGGDCSQTGCCGSLSCSGNVCVSSNCTVIHGAGTDETTNRAAGQRLIDAIANAQAGATITIEPGVYLPPAGLTGPTFLSIAKNLTLEACDPANKPILDGGATVTGAADANAKNLTWSGGIRIMNVAAGTTVVVDGVHFRNGNAATSTVSEPSQTQGGAIRSFGGLTLKNLDITRCQGGTGYPTGSGGVAALSGTGLVLNDVNVSQCAGYEGSAVYAYRTPLTITGSAGAKAAFHRNYAKNGYGAIYSNSTGGFASATTLTLQHLDIRHNLSDDAVGGLTLFDTSGFVSATIDNVNVEQNTGTYAGGMWLDVGKVTDSSTAKATLTNVNVKDNVTTYYLDPYAGGIYNKGKLHLGTGVVISGNKADVGSGILNQVPSANITCDAQAASGNTSTTNQAAVTGKYYADCFGAYSTNTSRPDVANQVPSACCATTTCTTVVCGPNGNWVCCASNQACVSNVCTNIP